MLNSAELSMKKVLNFWNFYFYDQVTFHAQVSWAWKKFYNLGVWKIYSSHFEMRDNFCRQDIASVVSETFQYWGLFFKEKTSSHL